MPAEDYGVMTKGRAGLLVADQWDPSGASLHRGEAFSLSTYSAPEDRQARVAGSNSRQSTLQ